jgi:hypothetical protein
MEKEDLRKAFDALKADIADRSDKGLSELEAALDAIGVIARPKS